MKPASATPVTCYLQEDPGNAAAWQAWALLERSQGAFEIACSVLREGLATNPDHEPSLHALAKLEIEQRHFKAARTLLQHTLRINPFHPHSWTTLAELSYIEGFPEQARVVFNSMIMHCGGDAVVYSTWGGMEARMGEQSALHRGGFSRHLSVRNL
jgi:predicted Zn-dependent protease